MLFTLERVFPVIFFQNLFLNSKNLTRLLFQYIILLFSFLLFLSLLSQAQAKDFTQTQRIISTSPSITEILFELGLKDRIVAVTDFCIYPKEACILPSIGGVLNPDIETMVSLSPDLIILQSDSVKLEKNFARLGIPTFSIKVETISDIFKSINRLGKALNCQERGDKLVLSLKEKINILKKRVAGRSRKKVLLLLGDSSNPARDLYAVGPGTFLNELLILSGGKNILQNSKAQYPKLLKEYIIEQSPEIIIEVGPKSDLSKKEISYRIEQWNRFPTIKAIKDKRIHFIGEDYILIPGPRLVKILEKFTKIIHPDLSHSQVDKNSFQDNLKP